MGYYFSYWNLFLSKKKTPIGWQRTALLQKDNCSYLKEEFGVSVSLFWHQSTIQCHRNASSFPIHTVQLQTKFSFWKPLGWWSHWTQIKLRNVLNCLWNENLLRLLLVSLLTLLPILQILHFSTSGIQIRCPKKSIQIKQIIMNSSDKEMKQLVIY